MSLCRISRVILLTTRSKASDVLARHIKNRWHLGESWSFCNLLSFTPLPPSKKVLRSVKICRLRSGGALSVLYGYDWGPRPYNWDNVLVLGQVILL